MSRQVQSADRGLIRIGEQVEKEHTEKEDVMQFL